MANVCLAGVQSRLVPNTGHITKCHTTGIAFCDTQSYKFLNLNMLELTRKQMGGGGGTETEQDNKVSFLANIIFAVILITLFKHCC